jgi:glycosyltransferase involved in cell wall biosynthesis
VIRLGIASGDWVNPKKTPENKERWGGSGWARVGQYIEYMPFTVVTGVLTRNKTHLCIMDVSGTLHDVDVILMQRLMHDGIANDIIKSRKQGIKIINDIDDWYWGLSPSNDAFKHNHPKRNPRENFNHYRSIIGNSDLVIASTPYLAGRVESFTNSPIEVIKNTVDVGRFTPHEHTDSDKVVVGWVGSTQHRSGDLETMRGILKPFVDSGSISLFHGGAMPKAPSFASRVGVPEDSVTTKPLVPHTLYPGLMVMDIGIVPLSNMPFNRAKSDIKGLEYAAAGVPFVASNLDAYIELQSELGIGRVSKKPVNWIKHIKDLMDYKVRKEEAERNRELVQKRDIRFGAVQLIEAIESVYNGTK